MGSGNDTRLQIQSPGSKTCVQPLEFHPSWHFLTLKNVTLRHLVKSPDSDNDGLTLQVQVEHFVSFSHSQVYIV